MENSGKLYVFEGMDGSGKTTLSRLLKHHFDSVGINSLLMTFPGQELGTLGRHIYQLHHKPLDFQVQSINPTSLQLLHVAAHIDAIDKQILPALRSGVTVILDRFWWSTWAYGSVYGANNTTLRQIIQAELTHWCGIKPTALFFLNRKSGFVEKGSTIQGQRIERAYLNLARRQQHRHPLLIIQNDKSIEETMTSLVKYIENPRMRSRFRSQGLYVRKSISRTS
mgnify:CR=1 FL=1